MKIHPQTHCLRCKKPSKMAICDACIKYRHKAAAINRKYSKIFSDIKTRLYGSDKDDVHKAACDQLKMMTAHDKELHATGYRNRDLDVDGSGKNTLILITEAWRKKQRDRRAKCLKSFELLEKGDYKGFKKLDDELRAHWYDNPDAPEKKS